MKYLKILFITILLLTIMIIPVNAATLTLPDLPGEYEDYIILKSPSTNNIIGITLNNLGNIYVATYDEMLDEIYPHTVSNLIPHSNDALYFTSTGIYNYENNLDLIRYKLVGDEWEYVASSSDIDVYQYGYGWSREIKNTDVLYSSKNIIDLTDGSVFFFKGSWMKEAMVRPMLGIIPFLIGLLIVLAGFLKGLQLLFKTLRKA